MTIPYPFHEEGTEAERLDKAADLAMADGDYQHAAELRARALAERRAARERQAGVRPL